MTVKTKMPYFCSGFTEAGRTCKSVSALYLILFENLFLTLENGWWVTFSCELKKIFSNEKENTHTIAYIKRQAKKIKSLQGISHTQALELISKE